MSFMVDFYKNKVAYLNSEWTKDRPAAMVEMFVDYWPFARWGDSGQNNKDRVQWLLTNKEKLQTLAVKADEVIAIMKTNNLL